MSIYWVEVGLGASVGGYILLRPRGMEEGGDERGGGMEGGNMKYCLYPTHQHSIVTAARAGDFCTAP